MVFGLALLGLTRKKRFPNRNVDRPIHVPLPSFATVYAVAITQGKTNWETHEDSVCSQVISCKHRQASFDVHSGKDPPARADEVEDRQ